MKTVNDYFNLAKEIHEDNVKAGWWSKPRSKECFYRIRADHKLENRIK